MANQMPEGTARNPSDLPEAQYAADLNPNFLNGQNSGAAGPHPELVGTRNAYDDKTIQRMFADRIANSDLKQIPIMPDGSLLEEGATYIDLYDPELREFTSRGDIEAGPGSAYVPKSAVDYQLWNILRNVPNQERQDNADDSSVRA